MQEKIGKVVLDYSRYTGQDFYSDGDIEQELLETVKNCSEEEYMKIIMNKHEQPFEASSTMGKCKL